MCGVIYDNSFRFINDSCHGEHFQLYNEKGVPTGYNYTN